MWVCKNWYAGCNIKKLGETALQVDYTQTSFKLPFWKHWVCFWFSFDFAYCHTNFFFFCKWCFPLSLEIKVITVLLTGYNIVIRPLIFNPSINYMEEFLYRLTLITPQSIKFCTVISLLNLLCFHWKIFWLKVNCVLCRAALFIASRRCCWGLTACAKWGVVSLPPCCQCPWQLQRRYLMNTTTIHWMHCVACIYNRFFESCVDIITGCSCNCLLFHLRYSHEV